MIPVQPGLTNTEVEHVVDAMLNRCVSIAADVAGGRRALLKQMNLEGLTSAEKARIRRAFDRRLARYRSRTIDV